MSRLLFFVAFSFSLIPLQLFGAPVDFSEEVLPILSNKCFLCHGPDAEEDEVRLDSVEGATADLGGYRALNREKPNESEILARIFDKEDPMPPAKADHHLSESEKEILKNWILEGGNFEEHWSFVPPTRPAPPANGPAIDAFLHARLTEAGADFSPEADKATLARRVALVLTGLPPELDQLDRFLADDRADAYERLVDELMANPRFGEHQARYWLDAVRYGDTHGLHLDNRRGIYPYRDWVVRAFNNNLPLDDFLIWQLAGDLLPSPTLEQKIATGFVRMNPSTAEGGAIPAEFQAKNNFDRVETLGTVLLGMTFNCARCHTHKYDPITQNEYFQLLAFFNNTAEGPMDGNKYEYGPVLKAPSDQTNWDAWKEAKAIVEKKDADPEAVEKATATLAELEKKFTTTLVAVELPKPRETRLLIRGEYDQPTGDPLAPDVPEVMGALPDDAARNRLGLAQWLTSKEHPLVSRVIANSLWQRVFGEPLVRTPEDFGLQGEQPTHPDLLDWLAIELQESGWDQQHMLRIMLTSRAFRQKSAERKDLDDPENRLLARGPRHRLDAEMIRDLGLWSSGLLDPHMGGEGVKPYQPSGMWLAMAHPGSNTKNYVADKGARLYRRSLYVYWKRTSPHPMMTLFDAPDRETSCVRRSRTSTPLQSLGLLNETQRVEMSRKLAERLLQQANNDEDRLALLFRLLASRPPSDSESKVCLKLLSQARSRFEAAPEEATALLKTGEADFDTTLSASELAAWTQVSATVLASDLSILLY